MKIFYVHHALRAKGNPPSQNDGIQEVGKQDAEIVAKIFLDAKEGGKNIKAIYTSPYFRCRETARIINKYIQVPVIEDSRLNEFVDERQMIKYGLKTEDIETWKSCQERIIQCIKDIVYSYSAEDIVICVTSGVNITAFISLAYKIAPSNDLPFPSVPSCSPIGFDIDKSNFDFINQ